jgi:hypothetical protein
MVTGYTIDPEKNECANCPFPIEVTKGWPPVHDKWECRAGSRPPNKKSEWRGNLNDKATMAIWSLDNELLESIREYCIAHPELGASYNQDLDDCRKVLSISCSANKKGMAAKKELVDKFFGEKQSEETYTGEYCINCASCLDEGESVEYRKCTKKRSFVTIKQKACDKFEPIIDELNEIDEDIDSMDLEDQFDELLKDGDKRDMNCKITKCGFNNEAGGCGFEVGDIGNMVFTEYAQEAIKLGCQNEALKGAFHNQPCLGTSPKKPRNLIDEVCEAMKEDCPCFCAHNDGCSVRLIKGNVLKDYIEGTNKQFGVLDCDIYKKVYEKQFPIKKTPEEGMMELVKPENKYIEEDKPQGFDYSTIDTDTAAFLQEKEAKITQIRMMSVLAIGKELKEVHEKLANNKTGTFGLWCKSLGMSDQSAMNYIRGYEYIAKNFGNIEDAENIQSSLLFAVSKQSAPAELQKAVIEGDITTHKQYKELEAQLKAREQEKKWEEEKARQNSIVAREADERARKAEQALRQSQSEHQSKNDNQKFEIEQLQKRIKELSIQTNNTQEPVEVSELRKQLKEAERQVEILTDELMKPVNLEPAVVEKEVERSADKDYEYVVDFLGKFFTVHTGQLKNWAKVLGENVNKQELERTKQNLIALNRNIGNMMDAIDNEIANK